MKARQIFASKSALLSKEVWDRADGKLADKNEVTGANGGPIEVVDARNALLDRINRIASRSGEARTDIEPGTETGGGDAV